MNRKLKLSGMSLLAALFLVVPQYTGRPVIGLLAIDRAARRFNLSARSGLARRRGAADRQTYIQNRDKP